MSTLPPNARVIDGPGVHVEIDALDQLAAVARLPRCLRAVGLPDLHPGPGIPIGAAFALEGEVRPLLVGGDAGCGVRVLTLPRLKASGDALERRVREATEGPALPGVDAAEALRAAWARGPRGLAGLAGVPDSLAGLAATSPPSPEVSAPAPVDPALGAALGTVGGGNHFIELSEVTAVADREGAAALDLRRGAFAVVAHSGSRGVGAALMARWGAQVLEGDAIGAYLAELAGALNFARANRLVLAWRLLVAAGAARAGRYGQGFDLVHNDVGLEDVAGRAAYVHRKGAAPARAGEPAIVLGSRGSPSELMLGAGAAACLSCVAHGAGRRMKRSEAVDKLKARYRREALVRTALGGRVICEDPELLYAEHPDAYKDIEGVVRALVAAGAARRVASLSPRVTVKR